ncbi:pyridine nucleotide-disulfide oxidoreductase [Paenibacillus sp. IHB B 3084]|uniref:FAD-dependent oxidoreductase n=1 Tax=Paenibacillus sp. IHB B 3084 TaxID=867076 RepID=UPI00071F9936|nr:FAD-dependent oxidoreductase [Paenibacillus sp. IHB B 3084]ALP35547.1 pyridine nucleotide-disulfide oxidoreductase [Paenibacillus sp. IHB B 3084]
MRQETFSADITVAGGGLAGVCAAVASARLGQTVALVQNRPVLGGNSSSEVRVWVCGATKHGVNRYARESGIMGELFTANQYRNPDGNPYLWDAVVLDLVRAEPNITLFLNTDIYDVESEGLVFATNESKESESKEKGQQRMIRAVTGWMTGSERRIRFESSMFLDCSGDGLVGFLAGAKYRLGRESQQEFGESLAPEMADMTLLGSTILFYTRDTGHSVKYVPPSFAKDIRQTPIPKSRILRSGDSGCHYWWIEWGGELDTVHDNERIRDELWSVIYGIWDYIKNSGEFDADTMTLEWVGTIPGKREYRRFIGDYTVHQRDIEEQTLFPDRVGFGGWSIDLHPPHGMYDPGSGANHLQPDGVYHIPFRSLYSANVSNLLFAGRNISATHVAFGTLRVMATCAVIGEAAGTGAALCVAREMTPRELCEQHLSLLQQTLLRQDASLLGVTNQDTRDIARSATVTGSSSLKALCVDSPDERVPLRQAAGLLFPVHSRVETVSLLVDVKQDTLIRFELWDTGKPQNYVPASLQASCETAVSAGDRQWVEARLPWAPDQAANAFLIVRANEHVSLYMSHQPLSGVLSFIQDQAVCSSSGLHGYVRASAVLEWTMRSGATSMVRKCFCFRIIEETKSYAPANIINGHVRPYGGPNMWVSDPLLAGQEAWIELRLPQKTIVREIHCTFNDDVNEDLINLHHHRTPFEVMPELVRHYRIEAFTDGSWVTLHTERNNRKRKRIHEIRNPVATDQLRLVVEATHGCPRAEIVEIRLYEQNLSVHER